MSSFLDKFKSEFTASKARSSAVVAFAGGITLALGDGTVSKTELIHATALGVLAFVATWSTPNKRIVQDIVDVVDPPPPAPTVLVNPEGVIIPPGTGI